MRIFGNDFFNPCDGGTDGDCPCAKGLRARDRGRVAITPLGHDPDVQPRKLLEQREIGLIRYVPAGVSCKRRADDVATVCDGKPGVFERRTVRHGYPAALMDAVDQFLDRHRSMAGGRVECNDIGTGIDERIDVSQIWRDSHLKIRQIPLDYANDRDVQTGFSEGNPRRAFEPNSDSTAIDCGQCQSDDTLIMVERTVLHWLA